MGTRTSSTRPRTALVLSGGGSRGAYEAGIILFLREKLGPRLGAPVPLDILTGTSVGAINAAFLASTADAPATQARRLVEAWRALRLEELVSLSARDILRAVRLFFGADPRPPTPGTFRYGGLLETGGLERFVVRAIPWRRIAHNIDHGSLAGLAVSATHVGTGHTVVFHESARGKPAPGWSHDHFVRHVEARIGPRHVLASAAIPLLFPAVKIRGEFYTDGGLRLNTPMSPAIRMGADRMLVVSLRHHAGSDESAELTAEREHAYPKPLFMFGKALDALMLDPTENDLDRMERINAIIDAGTRAFGEAFTERINRELFALRGARLRRLTAVHIHPSIDIGILAADFVSRGRLRVDGLVARRLIDRLGAAESKHETDLLSYLLFDGSFASELIDLGFSDAEAMEEELGRFFEGGMATGTGETDRSGRSDGAA